MWTICIEPWNRSENIRDRGEYPLDNTKKNVIKNAKFMKKRPQKKWRGVLKLKFYLTPMKPGFFIDKNRY